MEILGGRGGGGQWDVKDLQKHIAVILFLMLEKTRGEAGGVVEELCVEGLIGSSKVQ